MVYPSESMEKDNCKFQYLQINPFLTPWPLTFFIVEDISLKMEALIICWVLGNLFEANLHISRNNANKE